MADDNIDPFGEHDKRDSCHNETGEAIPLPPVTPGGEMGGRSTWEAEREQETSFGGMSLRTDPRSITFRLF